MWIDTETRPRRQADGRDHHHLWFGWGCYQRLYDADRWTAPVWQRFTRPGEFWSWVESLTRPKTRITMFAHNGAFDLPVLHAFRELPAREWKLTNAVVEAPPMILQWRRDGRTLRFIDTLNIWRMPLDQLGESLGVAKLPMPGPRAARAAWDRYCRRDVEVIRKAVLAWLAFLRSNDLGGFAPTLASQALRTFTHRFMSHKILIDSSEEALQLARNAYLGGRVECFRLGTYEGNFAYVDVNSMYPAVMREGKFPRSLLGVYKRPTRRELVTWLDHRSVIADVVIRTDEPAYPVVRDGRLQFPVGEFRATLAGPELRHAIEHDHLVRSSRAAVYREAPLFRDWVDWMYERKLAAQLSGDKVSRWLFKLLMNSLYGKFGQRGRRFEIVGPDDPDRVEVWDEIDADTGEIRRLRSFGGVLQEFHEESESRNSMPAIAAYVTSYARMALWRGLQAAGRSNVLYCDTDSMVVDDRGLERIRGSLDPERLGAWSLKDSFDRVTLHGPKDYMFGDTRRVKGVRHNATWTAPNAVVQDHFVGFRGLLREGQLDAPIVTTIEKKLARVYLKGDVGTDGRVSPFLFSLQGESMSSASVA